MTIILATLFEINAGIIGIFFSFVLMSLTDEISLMGLVSSFPNYLFLTLVGITLLFAQAQQNGTLERVSVRIVDLFSDKPFWIPICFFLLSFFLAAIGSGNIAATALVAPAAMASAKRLNISPFLMALMVANGANAGGLSPIAPTGIIAAERMSQMGITGLSWKIFFNSLIAHVVVAFGGYIFFGGLTLVRQKKITSEKTSKNHEQLELRHLLTLAIIFLVFLSVVLLKMDILVSSFAGVFIISACKLADHAKGLKHVPWAVIIMVCGVSMLTNLIDKTGGMDLFTTSVSKICTSYNVNAIVGFFSALVSVYSSSSGVVLPAFLLLIPSLILKIPGADPIALASSISISAHLVDVSPLSTIGALCLASAIEFEASKSRNLFRQMMIWGLSMTVMAGILSHLLF